MDVAVDVGNGNQNRNRNQNGAGTGRRTMENDTDTESIDRRFPLADKLIYGNANGDTSDMKTDSSRGVRDQSKSDCLESFMPW